MDTLIIRPLAELLTQARQRGWLTLGDLGQIENKITNNIKLKQRNTAQKHSIFTDKKHLAIVRKLQKKFNGQNKITPAVFAREVNAILKSEKLYYTPQEHKTAHKHKFLPITTGAQGPGRAYDLAFYNPLANPQQIPFHHESSLGRDVFYVRCEVFGNDLLVGNMQIDATKPQEWKNKNIGKILLAKKNIYDAMVQQVIKHALQKKYRRIMFQTSDAVEYSQWRENYIREIVITKQNFAKYQKAYNENLAKFDQLAVGDAGLNPERDFEIIINKTPEKYEAYNAGNFPDNVELVPVISALKGENHRYLVPSRYLQQMVTNYRQSRPALLLKSLDKICAAAQMRIPRPSATEAKVKYLRTLCAQQNNHKLTDGSIDAVGPLSRFLQKFGYEKEFLQANKSFIKITSTPKSVFTGWDCYFDLNLKENIVTLARKDILPPEIGKVYRVNTALGYEFLTPFTHHDGMQYTHLLNWYDQLLPKHLARHKLGYKKVKIKNNKITAHAWEITSGLEDFQERPITLFATGNEMKMDEVTLPALGRVARKFNLTPAQLKIINEHIVGPDGIRRLGAYNRQTGTVTLANTSLAILAHEGFHNLVAQKLVPQREYRALVAAGKALSRSSSRSNDYLDKNSQDEEHAARFVEKYYTHQGLARKKLLGAKITVTEKILGYIKSATDIIQARLGNDIALARCFLRRVEAQQLPRPARRQEIITTALARKRPGRPGLVIA